MENYYDYQKNQKITLESLREEVNKNIITFKNNFEINEYYENFGQLLGNLFAIWSLIDLQSNTLNRDNDNIYLNKQPHPVQVLSIVIMFNQHKEQKNEDVLQNQIAQIFTGQGKSITLGILCLIFALMGYDVDLACYSEYLCRRDYGDFQGIFKFLHVESKIKYSTFKQIIEAKINQNGNIRSLASCYFQDKNEYEKQLEMKQGQFQVFKTQQKKVLLIDEVDQLASDDLYGISYYPTFQIKEDYLFDIYEMIWKSRNDKIVFNYVQEMDQYQNLIKKYKQIEKLIENYFEQLCTGAKNIEQHIKDFNPCSYQGKFRYQEFDKISNCYYKYDTPFVYFKNFYVQSQPQESRSSIKDYCTISLNVSQISYAQILKDMNYNYIMGLTGTLIDLDVEVLKFFREYKINQFILCPSIYKKNSDIFKKEKDLIICNNIDQYYSRIYLESQKQIQPVLIFFPDIQKLNAYKNYLQRENKFDVMKYQELIVKEDQCYDALIHNATKVGMITLCLNIFGRGSDFKCYNSIINDEGGMVVIITQFCQLKVEEIQMFGRTGRGVQKGKGKIILNEQDLHKQFDIKQKNIQNWQKKGILYDEIDKIRIKQQSDKMKIRQQLVEYQLPFHQNSQKLVKALQEKDDKNIIKYLHEINQE